MYMGCTISQGLEPTLCTSRDIYGENAGVHHVYMRNTRRPQRKSATTSTPLRWRRTRIALWRKRADMTQQEVADHLAERSPAIELTRVSIARIETGEQMPSAEVLEAMAALFGVDVDTMLNLTPDEAHEVLTFKAMQPDERRRVLRIARAAMDREEP